MASRSSSWVLAALFAILAMALAARADDDADRAHEGARSGRLMPLVRIIEIVQARYPGEVLDVELDDDDDDGPEYEIKLLQRDGRILEIEIDARTGRFLEVGEDD